MLILILKIPENMNVVVDQKITVIHKKEDIEHLDDDLIVSPLALIKYYEYSNHQPTDYLYVFVDGVRQQIACNTPIAALVKDVKAVRVGETFYNHEQFNTLLNEETIENGVIETYDNTKCMVQEAFKRMRLNQEKSCGRCVFCREGYMQLVALFSDLTSGKCKEQDFEIMKEIVNAMSDYSNCSVGTNGKKTLLSLLENFNEEVLAHIKGECSFVAESHWRFTEPFTTVLLRLTELSQLSILSPRDQHLHQLLILLILLKRGTYGIDQRGSGAPPHICHYFAPRRR